MPLVSEFFGIKIYMYWRDHSPPHFHAEYGESHVVIDIENVVVLRGIFPNIQLKVVLAWAKQHKSELISIWESAKNYGTTEKNEPLH